MEDHVTRQLLEAVERGEVSASTLVRRMTGHLMGSCPACREEICGFLADRDHRWACGELVARCLLEVLGRWREELDQMAARAQAELDELLELAPGERRGRIKRARKHFRNPCLAELLLDRTRERVVEEPVEAAELAELATLVALHLDLERFGLGLPMELAQRARAHRANALRLAGRLGEADELMTAVLERTPQVTERASRAEILGLAAALRRDQRRFAVALELLEGAEALYRGLPDLRLTARTLLHKAQVLREMGSPAEAVITVREAVRRIDADREPHLSLYVRHELAWALAEDGAYEEAAAVLDACAALVGRFPDPFIALRRRWVQGRIAHGLGDHREAEAAYEEVWERCLAEEDLHDAALASLDLARLYGEQGRLEEVRVLTEATIPVFRSRCVEREAVASAVLLGDAVRVGSGAGERTPRLRG